MLNTVQVIGRVAFDPEVRKAGSGEVTGLKLAINESWKDKQSGQWKEKTVWLKVNCWDYLAGKAGALRKGDSVFVSGALETQAWTNKDGQKVESLELRADKLLKIEVQKTGGQSEGGGRRSEPQQREAFSQDLDDEIPF